MDGTLRRTRPWLAALLTVLAGCGGDPGATPPRPTVRVVVGGIPVAARLARTSAERRAGLAGVAHLAPSEGMLFVYPDVARRRFWMRGCRIPLDVAFLDADGTVFQVATLAAPRTADDVPAAVASTRASAFVLEVPAGFFRRHGLGPGTRVQLPAGVRDGLAERSP